MCGRYSITLKLNQMAERFSVSVSEVDLKPRYNLAPGQDAPAIVSINDNQELKMIKWGLVPHWAKDISIGYKTINARAETVGQKPSFRDALKRRRCLIPADGFYEWKKNLIGRSKTPFRFTLKDGSPFAFAGLWDRWVGPKEGSIFSFTIITTQANPLVASIHDRMPVILQKENEEKWLDPHLTEFNRLLTPYPADEMKVYEVGSIVNSAQNDLPECITQKNA